jgi:hypothetical protein
MTDMFFRPLVLVPEFTIDNLNFGQFFVLQLLMMLTPNLNLSESGPS